MGKFFTTHISNRILIYKMYKVILNSTAKKMKVEKKAESIFCILKNVENNRGFKLSDGWFPLLIIPGLYPNSRLF